MNEYEKQRAEQDRMLAEAMAHQEEPHRVPMAVPTSRRRHTSTILLVLAAGGALFGGYRWGHSGYDDLEDHARRLEQRMEEMGHNMVLFRRLIDTLPWLVVKKSCEIERPQTMEQIGIMLDQEEAQPFTVYLSDRYEPIGTTAEECKRAKQDAKGGWWCATFACKSSKRACEAMVQYLNEVEVGVGDSEIFKCKWQKRAACFSATDKLNQETIRFCYSNISGCKEKRAGTKSVLTGNYEVRSKCEGKDEY